MLNTRLLAARCCVQIIDRGRSLDRVLSELVDNDAKTDTQTDTKPESTLTLLSAADRSFVKELVFGICRWYGHLNYVSQALLAKPLRNKDRDIHFLLLIGLYQLQFLATADHAAVAATVNGAKQAKKMWAVKLLNACLRQFQRDQTKAPSSVTDEEHERNHPQWLVAELKANWPEHWLSILKANDDRPAMCLRVNTRRVSRTDYLHKLIASNIDATLDPMSNVGLILTTAKPVTALPGFSEGDCSVQDTAAQLAVQMLAPQPHERILDACAAPGGKLAHILEMSDNSADVDAIDIEPSRVASIQETLARLGLHATVASADASDPSNWPFANAAYDKILIDAPCSGTGVIRRHPDIRHHRRASDIIALQTLQAAILDACWSVLKAGGSLLYTTCSVLKTENEEQAKAFLNRHTDARIKTLDHPSALRLKLGMQTLPGVHPMDGFYYAAFTKA